MGDPSLSDGCLYSLFSLQREQRDYYVGQMGKSEGAFSIRHYLFFFPSFFCAIRAHLL